MIPTGRVLPVDGSPLDFRQPRPIGGVPLTTAISVRRETRTGGFASGCPTRRRSARSRSGWTKAFDYVVLYSGDPLPEDHRRRALAIEPMTCGSDAFNHPEWGLVALEPGQTLAGSWGVTEE